MSDKKKFIPAFVALLVGMALYAAAHSTILMLSKFGPTTGTALVTIAAGSSGVKNCISDIDVISDAAYTLRILDGGTTVYAVALGAGEGIVRSWDAETAMCGTAATATYISVSAGTYNINHRGFTQ